MGPDVSASIPYFCPKSARTRTRPDLSEAALLLSESSVTHESALRFGAQTDEVVSLLRIVNLVRTGEASTRPEIGRLAGSAEAS